MKLSLEQLKVMRKNAASLCHDSYVFALDELIAIRELKGDQVPVALVDERQGSGGFCLTRYGRKLNLPHGTELFTATQNPVVHPDTKRMDWLCSHVVEVRQPMPYGSHAMFYGQCDSDDCEEYHSKLREQIDEEVKADSGIVKGGDFNIK